jgi:hypothetical protein
VSPGIGVRPIPAADNYLSSEAYGITAATYGIAAHNRGANADGG